MESKIKILFSLVLVLVTFCCFTNTPGRLKLKSYLPELSLFNNGTLHEPRFDLTYIVNPNRIDKEEYQRVMNEFRQKGFELGFSETYKEDDLEQFKISLGSNWNKVSVIYLIEELRKKQYVIFIGANTETGDVLVVPRNSTE